MSLPRYCSGFRVGRKVGRVWIRWSPHEAAKKGVQPMRLLLIRHADAVKQGEAGAVTDFDRPLSDHGHSQARALADALAAQGVALDAVVTSPVMRAVQTAELLLRLVADPAASLSVCDHLAPEDFRRK